ncbi:TIGR04197 family type VII secretion effector [Streptococcus uberis]|uniref:TIGR04197 family type VII secretion effector n=1 Tax=Streptococcus uberis TaxID=1349 RepID=UPI002EB8A935|nr:TIGR04197 family type VII secretion effector [Streptococcus uberis]MEE3738902.1 TIGR04197 family type VII secretion effector [Streptococcus uberis]
MTIESNPAVAQDCATTISSSGATLLSITKASTDMTTTLSGNSNAHQAIDADAAVADSVAQAVNQFVNLIQSTSSAFESTDQRLGQMLANHQSGSNHSSPAIGQCVVGGGG